MRQITESIEGLQMICLKSFVQVVQMCNEGLFFIFSKKSENQVASNLGYFLQPRLCICKKSSSNERGGAGQGVLFNSYNINDLFMQCRCEPKGNFSVTKQFRHNFGIFFFNQVIEILNQTQTQGIAKNTECGRPVGSVISTMVCLCVKRLKRIHSCSFFAF